MTCTLRAQPVPAGESSGGKTHKGGRINESNERSGGYIKPDFR